MGTLKKIILLLVLLKVVALLNAWAEIRATSAHPPMPERTVEARSDSRPSPTREVPVAAISPESN